MAWTATLLSVDKSDPRVLAATVEYVDGPRTITETYKAYGQPAAEWLAQMASARLGQLNGIDATVLSTGLIPDPSTPTPAEVEIAAMRQDLRRLEIVERLVNLGVVPIDHAMVQTFVTKVRAEVLAHWNDI